jgi:hypothetical protein
MQRETYYDILGVPPDASHRALRKAFLSLRATQRAAMVSDPSALRLFEDAKAAYDALGEYEKRWRYNAENGLLPPPRPEVHKSISSLEEEENRLAFWTRYVRWSTWSWTWPRPSPLYIFLVFAIIGALALLTVGGEPGWLWERLGGSR